MPKCLSSTHHAIVAAGRGRAFTASGGLPDDLARALAVIIGWYEDPLGGGLPKRRTPPQGSMRSGEVVRRYLALRSEWENREAFALAARMSAVDARPQGHDRLRNRRAS